MITAPGGVGMTTGDSSIIDAEISVRERNRRDKLQRITAAARALFVEKGFDETTTREIARRADVALGTLFLYATDKRDLLFLICTDELEALTDDAFGAVPEKDRLIDELIYIFEFYYGYFAQQPGLSKYILRELTFFVSGVQGQRFQSNRHRVISQLVEHLGGAKARGLLKETAEPSDVGWVVFAIYQAEIREWLIDPAPDPGDGLRSLRRALIVALDGCAAEF
jgi:AcrR family transcriptional regulator